MEEEFFENELAKRFEEMLETNEEYYFDTEELEEIIIYYLELGDIEFAELASQYAIRLHPDSTLLKTRVLEVLLELEKYTDAKKIIEELKPTSMENVDFLVCCAKYYSLLGNPKRSIEYCKKALQYNEEEAFLHNFIADEYVNLEEPFLALKHYKEALNADPFDDYVIEYIMNCYAQLNKHKEAIDFLNTYLDEFPYSEMAWFEYGHYHFNRKNYGEAIRGFDYILAINPNAMSVISNKAACYEYLGQWEKAIEVYEELLEMEYTKAYTLYRIGMCHKELKQVISAIHYLHKAIQEDPQFYMGMMELSYLYEELGQMDKALQYAEEAVYFDNSNLDYYKRLSFLYIDANKLSKGLDCLKKIINTEPDRFYNWYAYAEILMLLEEYEEAITILQSALHHHNRAEIYYQLSNAYFHLNEEQKGTEALENALHLNADLLTDMEERYPFIKKKKTGKKEKKKK